MIKSLVLAALVILSFSFSSEAQLPFLMGLPSPKSFTMDVALEHSNGDLQAFGHPCYADFAVTDPDPSGWGGVGTLHYQSIPPQDFDWRYSLVEGAQNTAEFTLLIIYAGIGYTCWFRYDDGLGIYYKCGKEDALVPRKHRMFFPYMQLMDRRRGWVSFIFHNMRNIKY